MINDPWILNTENILYHFVIKADNKNMVNYFGLTSELVETLGQKVIDNISWIVVCKYTFNLNGSMVYQQ